jgi:hypothetical protein
MLHVWELKDGRISRENVWFDGNAILEQLATTELTGASPHNRAAGTASRPAGRGAVRAEAPD